MRNISNLTQVQQQRRRRNHANHFAENATASFSGERKLSLPSLIALFVLLTLPIYLPLSVGADDSAAAPALDIGTLASLASNLGGNPQIMSMVTSLLNPSNQQQKQITEQDTNSIVQQEANAAALNNQLGSAGEPLRRSSRQSQQPPQASSEPKGNILSGLNLSGLSGLLSGLTGGGSKASASPTTAVASASSQYSQQPASPAGAARQFNPNTAPTMTASAISSAAASAIGQNQNSAQSVINQVLTAYAMGQIPNELIQLGLSGRVPPQIIELALSGQVPAPLIQMIITGQVPMPTIYAFLNAIQGGGTNSLGQSTARPGDEQAAAGASRRSTTRTLFEALFSRSKSGGLSVPTPLGSFPIQIPSARRFGQLVGGTITNVASMIPF